MWQSGILHLQINNSVIFLASTVPSGVLKKLIEEADPLLLVVSEDRLKDSYSLLIRERRIRMLALSERAAFSFIQNIVLLFCLKLAGKNIIFFHEGFWVALDMAILVIKPKGFFFPQLPHIGWRKISGSEIYAINDTKSFSWLRNKVLSHYFDLYAHVNDNANGYLYASVVKRYPDSIKKMARPISESINNDKKSEASGKVIFFVGADTVDANYLSQLYMSIMRQVSGMGYEIYVKNHPNPNMRLSINLPVTYKELDAVIPAETIANNFEWAVSGGSASLRLFGASGISILELCQEMAPEIRKERIAFLKGIDSSINFPASLEDLKTLVLLTHK